jgi:hypothetical protein
LSLRKDVDADKIPIFRPRLGVDGRTFFMFAFAFQCSTLDLEADELVAGELSSLSSQFSLERLKADYTEAATAEEAVFTRVRWWPPYTYDIKAGYAHLDHNAPIPSQAVRLFAQLAPRIPAEFGGQKVYIAGADFRFHTDFQFDGVTTTTIPFLGEQVPSNEIEVLVSHPAGYSQRILVMLEIFK